MRSFSPYFPCVSWRWRRKSEESLVSRLESYYMQVVTRRGNRKKTVLVTWLRSMRRQKKVLMQLSFFLDF
jgi:hypothetical protein